MNKLEQFIIPESEDQSRLDRCLRRNLGKINQSLLEKSLRNKHILLNGKKAKASDKIEKNQVITYETSLFLKDKRVCFLDGSVDELYRRATKKRNKRPLLKDLSESEFANIYQNRKNHYNECASLSVITDGKTIEEIVKEIISHEKFNF